MVSVLESLNLDPQLDLVADVGHGALGQVTIAVGPEGGLEDSERAQFVDAGWRLVSLGVNVLRFETAGVAALAVVRAHLSIDPDIR